MYRWTKIKKKYFSKQLCLNCNCKDHTFKYCKKPIISYGLLAFQKKEDIVKYIVVQRRDTIGYIDFLRGKYSCTGELCILLEEMTHQEHYKLKNYDFNQLWTMLWVSHSERNYKNEYEYAKKKFYSNDIFSLLTKINTKYIETEYDLPKGRKFDIYEKEKLCAKREFMEETGYKSNEFIILDGLPVLEETFIGSNGVWYTHIYFITQIITDRFPKIGDHPLQEREIKSVKFLNFKECVNSFRLYDSTKRNVIYNARKIIERL